MRVELPYGRAPYPVDGLDFGDHAVILPPEAPATRRPVCELLDAALDAPIGRPRIEDFVAGPRVTFVVSDATRNEPRAELLAALLHRLPAVRATIAIATGTHGPADISALGIPGDLLARAHVVNHDGHRDADLVALGTTTRGTPVRVHRCAVEADLVIATGCIRPHYFAGFGAGVKAIFPGLGAAADIRANHELKTRPGARAGNVDGNPCRADLEEAVSRLPVPTYLLDGVCASDGAVHAAVAGDPVLAFRAGVALARPWFAAATRPAPRVVASDALPVTATLYQSAKIAAAVAPLVEPNGTLVLVAECADGIGPLAVVNEAIFRIGVLPRLAAGVRLELVSSLSRADVDRTLLAYSPSLSDSLGRTRGRTLVVPRASQLLFEV